VKHNGGDRLSHTSDAQVIDEDEVVTEKVDRSVTIGEQEMMGVITHNLQEIPPEECRLVDSYLSEHPGYSHVIHQLDMSARVEFVHLQMRNHGWTPSPPETSVQANPVQQQARRHSEAHHYRDPINKAWDKATNKKSGVQKRWQLDEEGKKEWNEFHSQLGKEAKRLAGEPKDRELHQIQKLDALEIILTFLEEMAK